MLILDYTLVSIKKLVSDQMLNQFNDYHMRFVRRKDHKLMI